MKKTFKVEIELPARMTVREMRAYIEDAVESWRGSYEPGVDPRFDIDPETVKVTKMEKKARAK